MNAAIRRARKKPVEIEFMVWNGWLTSNHEHPASPATRIINWVLAGGGTARFVGAGEYHPLRYSTELYPPGPWGTKRAAKDAPAFIVIDTPEGPHRANPFDCIIRGVKGKFYPCKPDIFEATYDIVS